jgi:hypothetical protein
MKRNMIVVFVVVAAVLLYLFSRRTTTTSTAPVSQTGIAAGGVNFTLSDEASGLPVFSRANTPAQFVNGYASNNGSNWVCPSGTTPAIDQATGGVFCVIPAQTGYGNVVSSAYTSSGGSTIPAPQGPTQSGGFLDQSNASPTFIGPVQPSSPGQLSPFQVANFPSPDPTSDSGVTDYILANGQSAGSVFFS